MVSTTASAFSGSPFEKLTPSRSLKRQVRSLVCSKLSASQPSTVPAARQALIDVVGDEIGFVAAGVARQHGGRFGADGDGERPARLGEGPTARQGHGSAGNQSCDSREQPRMSPCLPVGHSTSS
jgi:hypothetical protein